jgi:aminodeoxyfutalosine deaminase
MTDSAHTILADFPKVELHVHLEGSVQPETLLRLAERHDVALPAQTVEEMRALYDYTTFLHFLKIYQLCTGVLRDAEDFAEITYEFLQQQAAQNVRYSEVMVSLSDHLIRGIPAETVLEGVFDGQRRGERDFGTRMSVILDPGRQWPEYVTVVSHVAVRHAGNGVIGFGIGGDEANFPPDLFVDDFERARAAGLHRTAHAGEAAGVESMWGAVRLLGAERLGHGVHAHEDPELFDYLHEHRIAIDMCPVSNVKTGAVTDIVEHPIRSYLQGGLLVTVNSDDPPMFGTSITNEFQVLRDTLGFTDAELQQLSLNAVEASFLPAPDKRALHCEIEDEFRVHGPQ